MSVLHKAECTARCIRQAGGYAIKNDHYYRSTYRAKYHLKTLTQTETLIIQKQEWKT